MRHFINPTIDCVFKAILGSQENIDLLCHFLNGILSPLAPITSVEILNPYNEREFLTDKLSVVDIKAKDQNDISYQIEIQMSLPSYLRQRMLYTWGKIYQAPMKKGKEYNKLKPVISIWLLTDNLFDKRSKFNHCFKLIDSEDQQLLTDDLAIHVIELKKWKAPDTLKSGDVLKAKDIWPCLFANGKNLKHLPDYMNTPEMRKVMKILERFSEQEREYLMYHDREDFLREQRTRDSMLKESEVRAEELKIQMEESESRLEASESKLEASESKLEASEAEKQHLLELLRKAGISPKV